MMNPFPLMYLSLIAYAVVRIGIGGILIFFGYQHLRAHSKMTHALKSRFSRFGGIVAYKLALVEIVIGLMYIAGFYTQIAALLALMYAIKMLVLRNTLSYPLVPSPAFFGALIFISLSLFITGAGAFAFDLPI